MNYKSIAMFGFLLTIVPATASAQERYLFKFDEPEIVRQWQAVNDGVMGGLSSGRFEITEGKHLRFFGSLSLANNGGFASVRASASGLALKEGESIIARVRGDGRVYNFNLYTQSDLAGYSYRQSFKTRKDEWIEVKLAADEFTATWRGQVFPEVQLDPGKVKGMGILLGDKNPGPFQLEVEWIKAGTFVN